MKFARPADLPPIAPWIWLCAWLNATGWLLSAFHALNRTGYVAAFALGLAIAIPLHTQLGFNSLFRINLPKLRRRFARPLPLAFAALAALAILGGVLYPPSNYDGLSYRIPRVLHWLTAEQWHWIHSGFFRLNTRACGHEWVSAPLILFTNTDRWVFLLGAVPLLFLPGLFFSLLTRLGAHVRVAAKWMWLLPTGYCYVLQAGGIGNDLFGAVFVLAAVELALRARASRDPRHVWLSVIAAALVTASKTTNLPLVLPWVVAIAPVLPVMLRRPVGSALVCGFAIFASLVPVAVMNWKHCGDWTGLSMENGALDRANKVVRAANNAALLTVQNFAPPIFPLAPAWNRTVPKFIPRAFAEKTRADFEAGGANWSLGELQIEESAGLGFGVSALLLVSFFASRWRRARPTGERIRLAAAAVLIGAGISLLAFMVKSNLSGAARLVSPYYGLLVPVFLLSRGHANVIRMRWWRWAAGVVFALAFLLVIVSPARPLWPVQTILTKFDAAKSANPFVRRAQTVYSVYGERSDGFKPARDRLPPGLTRLGLVTFDEPETSLWRPFGSRVIEHVMAPDTAEDLRRRNLRYVLVSAEAWSNTGGPPLATWAAERDGEIVETFTLRLRAATGPSDWHLVKLRRSEP